MAQHKVNISDNDLEFVAECIREASEATKQTANLNFNSQGMRILRKRKDYDMLHLGVMHRQLESGRNIARQMVQSGTPYFICKGEIIGLEYDYRLNMIDFIDFMNPKRFDPYAKVK